MEQASLLTVKNVKTGDTLFDRFWAAYPRRVAKRDAQKAFKSLKADDALVDKMIAALAWQSKTPQWTKDGGQYVPYPGSWLRAGQWEDEPFHAPSNARGFDLTDKYAHLRGTLSRREK